MKLKTAGALTGALVLGALVVGCFHVTGPALMERRPPVSAKGGPVGSPGRGGGGGEGQTETVSNNLSFPVLWADTPMSIGEQTASITSLGGEWVYVAGQDSGGNPIIFPASTPPGEIQFDTWRKAFLQQSDGNFWTADARRWSRYLETIGDAADAPLVVDWIDWGDNLESQDWTTSSQVRTEVVLLKDLDADAEPLYGYEMLHVSGLGVDEMHGLNVALDESGQTVDIERASALEVRQPTVYSNRARLTIQKLNFSRDDHEKAAQLTWDASSGEGRWVSVGETGNDLGLVEDPLFNEAVYNNVTGRSGYSAEINIKGRVVYGYTWNTREGALDAGDYRITFSLDDESGARFDDTTRILESTEEETAASDGGGTAPAGGITNIVPSKNLTYVDVRLSASGGGGGAGHGNGGGKGRGGGNHGGGGAAGV